MRMLASRQIKLLGRAADAVDPTARLDQVRQEMGRNRVPPSIEAKCRLRTEYMSGQNENVRFHVAL